MKYLFAIVLLGILAACGGSTSPTNTTTAAGGNPHADRLIRYVNSIALSTPGWDNNDITSDDFYQKLCRQFDKDIKDSNLLEGAYFLLRSLTSEIDKSYTATFEAFDVKSLSSPNSTLDSTTIHFEVFASIPDSLAKSIKNTSLYSITSYEKNNSDSIYHRDLTPIPLTPNDGSHTLKYCWLGSHHIVLHNIKNIISK